MSRLSRLREQFASGQKSGAYWGLSGDCFGGQADADGVPATDDRGPNPGAETQALWRVAANFVRLRPEVQQALEEVTAARLSLRGSGKLPANLRRAGGRFA
jgi:hypothetical protein